MTSLAFMLGVMPLVLASGAGSASQRAIGTSVLGGMLTARCWRWCWCRCSSSSRGACSWAASASGALTRTSPMRKRRSRLTQRPPPAKETPDAPPRSALVADLLLLTACALGPGAEPRHTSAQEALPAACRPLRLARPASRHARPALGPSLPGRAPAQFDPVCAAEQPRSAHRGPQRQRSRRGCGAEQRPLAHGQCRPHRLGAPAHGQRQHQQPLHGRSCRSAATSSTCSAACVASMPPLPPRCWPPATPSRRCGPAHRQRRQRRDRAAKRCRAAPHQPGHLTSREKLRCASRASASSAVWPASWTCVRRRVPAGGRARGPGAGAAPAGARRERAGAAGRQRPAARPATPWAGSKTLAPLTELPAGIDSSVLQRRPDLRQLEAQRRPPTPTSTPPALPSTRASRLPAA